MAKYHINEKGEPGACRAKKRCPFGDIDSEHFSSTKIAREFYETSQEMSMREENVSKFPTHEATFHALNASLTYDGVEPEWFASYRDDAKKKFPSDPEIIDVIETSKGPLAVVWEKHSQGRMDYNIQKERGIGIRRLVYFDFATGEQMGYLSSGFATEESMKASWGDDEWAGLRCAAEYQGHNLGIKEWVGNFPNSEEKDVIEAANTPEELLAAKKKIWANSHKAFQVIPEGFDRSQLTWGDLINLKESHAPEDEAKLDEDLAKIRAIADKDYEEFKANQKQPSIDFSRVEDKLRGEGLGTSLYVYTARKLAEEDKTLMSSGLQSDEAQRAWARMATDENLPIKRQTSVYRKTGKYDSFEKKSPHYVLDFRKG